MKCTKIAAIAVAGLLLAQASANAGMEITEWMYSAGPDGALSNEFIEFTNVGTSSINMLGWSFDDDGRSPGSVSLSAFGVVAPGESVILTEGSEANFRASWNLPSTVKIIGGNSDNLGRNDEINLYNGTTLVDRLTYGDQAFDGTIRTQNASGNPLSLAALADEDPTQWVLSANGDAYGSYLSVSPTAGHAANPGSFSLYSAPSVPEPGSLVLLALGASLMGLRRRGK